MVAMRRARNWPKSMALKRSEAIVKEAQLAWPPGVQGEIQNKTSAILAATKGARRQIIDNDAY